MTTKQVTRKQLEEAIQAGVKKYLAESNHFSAMRNIQHAATSTAMEFEKNIIESLGIMDPDQMQPQLQEKYFQVVTAMKDGLVGAVMDAAKQLVTFPKKPENVK